MKNLIMNAFALKEDYATSMQLGGNADEGILDIYMKNILVSLQSAKLQNPEDDVILVTNQTIPEYYELVFAVYGIPVKTIPFDTFVMPKNFVWSLAFFKLCALSYMVKNESYDHIVLLDADTVTMHSYADMWKEAEHGVMLFEVGHSYSHPDRWAITEAYRKLYGDKDGSIVHIGGEYICGTRENLSEFMKVCEEIYEDMKADDFSIFDHAGDEFILSVAAHKITNVINASPYIYRYWTEKFYLVSTNTTANPVCIWHLPNEKKTGMLRLYRYHEKHQHFPTPKKCAKMTGIVKARRPFNGYLLANKIRGKLEKFRKA